VQPNNTSYSISRNDFVAAQRLHYRRFIGRRNLLRIVLFGGIMLAGLSIFVRGQIDAPGLASACLIVATGLVVSWLAIPFNSRRTWNQRKTWDEVHARWDSGGITMKSGHGDGNFGWSDFYRWTADRKILLLYLDARLFYVLPLRAFPPGTPNDIVVALRSAGVQQR
jgi:hypothetical protein